MKKTRQLHLFFEQDLYDKLKQNAEKEGIYLSQYIREVLGKWYNKDVIIIDKKLFEDAVKELKQMRKICDRALSRK